MKYVTPSKRALVLCVLLIVFSITMSACGIFGKKCPDCPSFSYVEKNINSQQGLNN